MANANLAQSESAAKKVVLCDFDGTIIKGNIENTFLRYLLTKTTYKWRVLVLSLFTLPINLILNRLNNPSVFKSWTYVLGRRKQYVMEEFLESDFLHNSNGVRYRTDVIKLLNSIQYDVLIILTGSDEDLVRAFLTKGGKLAVDKIIGSQVGKNYFVVKRHPYGKGKCKFVNPKFHNIAIANSHSDRFYMDICNEKYYV